MPTKAWQQVDYEERNMGYDATAGHPGPSFWKTWPPWLLIAAFGLGLIFFALGALT